MFLVAVIEELHREIDRCRVERSRRGFEEFIPIKSCKVAEDAAGEAETDCEDKMNWMSSAQLWSDNYAVNNDHVKNHDEFISEEVVERRHLLKRKRRMYFFARSLKLNHFMLSIAERCRGSWERELGP